MERGKRRMHLDFMSFFLKVAFLLLLRYITFFQTRSYLARLWKYSLERCSPPKTSWRARIHSVLFCSVLKGTLSFHPQVFKAEARQILLIVQKVSVSGGSVCQVRLTQGVSCPGGGVSWPHLFSWVFLQNFLCAKRREQPQIRSDLHSKKGMEKDIFITK